MPGTGAREVTIGTTPFVILLALLVVILFVFPELALWLPSQMMPGRRSDRASRRVQMRGGARRSQVRRTPVR